MIIDKVAEAKRVFDIEIEALQKTKDALDETFIEILDLITSCEGKVIITGIGKPGHIARKLSSTMASLGTPSFCLHPSEALHGDLGMISDKDVVIAISYSGESEEITRIIPNIRMIGAKIIAISGNANSTLVKYSDVAQIFPKFDEACHLNLAPTSSTTATLVYGDALAILASRVYGYTEQHFSMYHPAGSLGKMLILKVENLMVKESQNPIINKNELLTEAIIEMSKKALGVVFVTNENKELTGIVTDGDLRRVMQKKVDVYSAVVQEVMVLTPTTIRGDVMAVEALKIMREKNINCLPVVDENMKVVGTITLQMLVKAGIVI